VLLRHDISIVVVVWSIRSLFPLLIRSPPPSFSFSFLFFSSRDAVLLSPGTFSRREEIGLKAFVCKVGLAESAPTRFLLSCSRSLAVRLSRRRSPDLESGCFVLFWTPVPPSTDTLLVPNVVDPAFFVVERAPSRYDFRESLLPVQVEIEISFPQISLS